MILTTWQDVHPVENFEVVVGMFLAVLVLQYAALRLRLPPAVALLLGGGGGRTPSPGCIAEGISVDEEGSARPAFLNAAGNEGVQA